jgi:hypothetical protein
MTTTLTHDDGSALVAEDAGWAITPCANGADAFVTVAGPSSPTTPPVRMTLEQVEALSKALGEVAAKLRGMRAK